MAVVCIALNLYLIALFARIILSWFPMEPGGALAGVVHALHLVTEPVLAPLRRALPPVRAGAMALDLSPIIVLILLQLIMGRLGCGGL